jgi:hypothetical protein
VSLAFQKLRRLFLQRFALAANELQITFGLSSMCGEERRNPEAGARRAPFQPPRRGEGIQNPSGGNQNQSEQNQSPAGSKSKSGGTKSKSRFLP